MKKIVSLLIALCVMAGCSSQTAEEIPNEPVNNTPTIEAPTEPVIEESFDYPVLEVSDLSAMTLATAENDTLRISYPEELFAFSDENELFTLLLNEDPSVNIQVIKDVPLPNSLDKETFDGLFASAMETVENFDLLTFEVSELRQLNEQPVFYLEYCVIIDDHVLDALLANGSLTQVMIDQAGGREIVKGLLPPIRTVQIGAVVDDYLTVYTGGYTDGTHKQTLVDTIAVLAANTEFIG